MTCIGYTIALSISLYILWTFGRTDGLAFTQLLKEMTVLGFPPHRALAPRDCCSNASK
jgi:uncharacterized membrane protein